jgi:photosystem II stability/assembly factor-like uncharacterized protein
LYLPNNYMSKLIKLTAIMFSLFQIFCSQPNTVSVLPAIRDVSIVNTNETWIVTEKGKVIHLLTDGKTQEEIKFETTARQIFFLNTNEGWILDSDGQLWATVNNGKEWIKRGSFAHDIASIDLSSKIIFADNQIGWMINSFWLGLTEDGGNTWKQIFPNEEFSYSKLEAQPTKYFPVNKDVGWLGMSNGKVLRTINRGQTWENVNLSGKYDIRSLYCSSDKECWISAWNAGELYYTNDGGKNWQPKLDAKFKGDLGIKSISFATLKIGWIAAIEFVKDVDSPNKLNGVVLKTTDGGKTWARETNEFYKNPFREIKFTNEQNGWLISEDSVYQTVDDGNNWQKIFQIDSSDKVK